MFTLLLLTVRTKESQLTYHGTGPKRSDAGQYAHVSGAIVQASWEREGGRRRDEVWMERWAERGGRWMCGPLVIGRQWSVIHSTDDVIGIYKSERTHTLLSVRLAPAHIPAVLQLGRRGDFWWFSAWFAGLAECYWHISEVARCLAAEANPAWPSLRAPAMVSATTREEAASSAYSRSAEVK